MWYIRRAWNHRCLWYIHFDKEGRLVNERWHMSDNLRYFRIKEIHQNRQPNQFSEQMREFVQKDVRCMKKFTLWDSCDLSHWILSTTEFYHRSGSEINNNRCLTYVLPSHPRWKNLLLDVPCISHEGHLLYKRWIVRSLDFYCIRTYPKSKKRVIRNPFA